MAIKPKDLAKKLLPRQVELSPADVQEARTYVKDYWATLTVENASDKGTLIGLPRPYVVPSRGGGDFHFDEQYYWDSYMTAIGLSEPEYETLVEGMLDNLLYLLKRFGVIPNGSRMYFVGRSQPPLLTSYIFYVYDTFHKSEEWLRERIEAAQYEYEQVWMSTAHPFWHNVHNGLSRYYDVNVMHDMAEMESGWDMTPRFERKCLDYLPVDLNALLYKYETDFARAAQILKNPLDEQRWLAAADKRKDAMNKLMWGKLRGFYFDYNYQRQELGTLWSLAGFYPMWAGMVSDQQAGKMVENLDKFERAGGLTTTTRPLIDMTIFGSIKTQWAYPNGWAPLHLIVTEALRRYGYNDEAKRIAHKWLSTNADWFKRHHEFLEKYNVVNTRKYPIGGVYPGQAGFGWSNAIFERFCKDYID